MANPENSNKPDRRYLTTGITEAGQNMHEFQDNRRTLGDAFRYVQDKAKSVYNRIKEFKDKRALRKERELRNKHFPLGLNTETPVFGESSKTHSAEEVKVQSAPQVEVKSEASELESVTVSSAPRPENQEIKTEGNISPEGLDELADDTEAKVQSLMAEVKAKQETSEALDMRINNALELLKLIRQLYESLNAKTPEKSEKVKAVEKSKEFTKEAKSESREGVENKEGMSNEDIVEVLRAHPVLDKGMNVRFTERFSKGEVGKFDYVLAYSMIKNKLDSGNLNAYEKKHIQQVADFAQEQATQVEDSTPGKRANEMLRFVRDLEGSEQGSHELSERLNSGNEVSVQDRLAVRGIIATIRQYSKAYKFQSDELSVMLDRAESNTRSKVSNVAEGLNINSKVSNIDRAKGAGSSMAKIAA